MELECDPVFARVDKLLDLLNKSKSLHILYLLNLDNRPMRFSEIKKRVDSSSTTVTRRLNELEANGLVAKELVSSSSTTIAYGLTETAQHLAPTIQSMYDWIVQHKMYFV